MLQYRRIKSIKRNVSSSVGRAFRFAFVFLPDELNGNVYFFLVAVGKIERKTEQICLLAAFRQIVGKFFITSLMSCDGKRDEMRKRWEKQFKGLRLFSDSESCLDGLLMKLQRQAKLGDAEINSRCSWMPGWCLSGSRINKFCRGKIAESWLVC